MVFKKNKTISYLLLCMTLSLLSCSKSGQYGMQKEQENLGAKRPKEDIDLLIEQMERIDLDDLPVGDSDIKNVLRSGYYADKTNLIGKLFMEGKPTFMIRPRRFVNHY